MSSRLEMRTEGLKAMAESAGREALDDSIPLADEAGEMMLDLSVRRLSRPAPSAPGQYPGRESGHLAASMGWKPAKRSGRTVVGIFGLGVGPRGRRGLAAARAAGTNVFEAYGIHEFGGTRQGIRIPPRPFIRPTLAWIDEKLTRILERDQ